jgi:hypothetical protein
MGYQIISMSLEDDRAFERFCVAAQYKWQVMQEVLSPHVSEDDMMMFSTISIGISHCLRLKASI